MKQNSIVLNGKTYDLNTGHVITPASRTESTPAAIATPKVIDGFSHATHKSTAHPTAHASHSGVKAKRLHHRTQPAKTLMRNAVKKPASNERVMSIRANKPLQHLPEHDTPLAPVDRIERSHRISKSPQISRFGDAQHMVHKKTTHAAPKAAPHHHVAAEPELPIASFLEDALNNASSHLQISPKPTKRHHKMAKHLGVSPSAFISVSLALLAFVSLGAWTIRRAPSLAVQVASNQAGVRASLPAYQPSGFALNGHVQYAKGKVVLSFKSKSDSRAYTLTQQNSTWNSESLQDSYLKQTGQSYHVEEQQGKQIYLYGDSDASWVDGGVWYQVQGQSALNTDQLLKIAASF